MEIIVIILLIVGLSILIFCYGATKKKTNHLIVDSDYTGKYEPYVEKPKKLDQRLIIITKKIQPLKSKFGKPRKTKSDHIDNSMQYILFDQNVKLCFYYSGNNGLKQHKIMLMQIIGTENGIPVYIRGNKIVDLGYDFSEDDEAKNCEVASYVKDLEDSEDLGKFLTFKLDRMMNIDYKDRIYNTPNFFISTLLADYPSNDSY